MINDEQRLTTVAIDSSTLVSQAEIRAARCTLKKLVSR